MSTTGSALEAFEKANGKSLNQVSQTIDKITKVYVRLVFLRIGEIDTLNEKYQAQLSIESRWPIDIDRLAAGLSSDDQKRLVEGKSVTVPNYATVHWHPQLYIENALGDLKEQIRYTAKQSKEDRRVYVCEHRDVKGVFWEKLELQHFPSDVQDLSISIASMLYDDKVLLVNDPHHLSGVNRETFVDQQEWSLYEHVDTQQRFIKEFIFRGGIDEDDDENGTDQCDNSTESEDRKQSILTVTCHAARRSNYFFWNGYCLIFWITAMSLCIFGISAHLTANRIQIACTLLLTSITFRWTVNRSLPTISYLTSMDIYAIMCIFMLIVQCIWHGIIGAVIFLNTPDGRVTPNMWLTHVDQYVFFIALGVFIIIHIALLTWMFFVPLKHRRQMKRIDIQYRLSLLEKTKRPNNQCLRKGSNIPSSFARIPIET